MSKLARILIVIYLLIFPIIVGVSAHYVGTFHKFTVYSAYQNGAAECRKGSRAGLNIS